MPKKLTSRRPSIVVSSAAAIILLVAVISAAAAAISSVASPSFDSLATPLADGQDRGAQLGPSISKQQQQHPNRYKRRLASAANSTGNLLPEFGAPIGNITAVLGRDVRLVCTVDNLGHYQVAWLKEETKTILSIDTNIIITNYRIFLIPDEEERKWVLHIKDVQESDRGYYQCQVNTKPMRSTSGYLEVVVPPSINESQTSQLGETNEHSNVSLQCKANGHPKPTITWRRDDGQPIRLQGKQQQPQAIQMKSFAANGPMDEPDYKPNYSPLISSNDNTAAEQLIQTTQLIEVKSDKLTLVDVDRSMAGLYVCSASNGIQSQVSKRIPVHVKFAPKVTVQNKYISVSLNEQLDIDCLVESYPKASSYWSARTKRPIAAAAANRWPAMSSHRRVDYDDDGTRKLAAQTPTAGQRGKAIYEQVARFTPAEAAASPSPTVEPRDGSLGRGPQIRSMPSSKLAFGDVGEHLIAGSLGSSPRRRQLSRRQRQQQSGANSNDENEDEEDDEDAFASRSFSSQASNNAKRWPPMGGGKQDASVDINSGSSSSKGLLTVKQTVIGPHSHRLRLTIERMTADNFGEYTCVASNALGQAEAHVIVTSADKQQAGELGRRQQHHQQHQPQPNAYDEEQEYQRDSLHSESSGASPNSVRSTATTTNSRPLHSDIVRNRNSQNRVVYDENYLQAIKDRALANGDIAAVHAATGKLQQKLRPRPYTSNRGHARTVGVNCCWIIVNCLIIVTAIMFAQ